MFCLSLFRNASDFINGTDNCNISWNYNTSSKYMSSKILERLNKTIFETIRGNKNLSKIHGKKHVLKLQAVTKNSNEGACDGVCF